MGLGKPDAIERYFLRRRAINHRDMPNRGLYYQHVDALLETILLFFGAPAMALASAALIIHLKWEPSREEWLIRNAGTALFTWGLAVAILGRWWFGKKLSKYLSARTAYVDFGSKVDIRIAAWQKRTVLLLCIIIIPVLSMLFTFGTQVLTKAFG
jgi:hypothetical protein